MTEPFEIIHSNRKTVNIQIKSDGRVVVRAPLRMSNGDIRRLVEEKADWIEKHLAQIRRQRDSAGPAFTAGQLRQLAEAARQDLPRRAARFAPLVGVSYGRITIRAQKSRWGSCSTLGNLNFNCLLMLCPEEVRDYVVVHELCHRKEMNHSERFWRELARVLPDYETPRKWLKTTAAALSADCPEYMPRSCFRSWKRAVGDAGPYAQDDTGFCGNQRSRRGRRPLHGFLREPEDPSGTPAPACSPEVCRKGQKCQAQGETFRAATQGRPYDRTTKHGRRGASRCARKKTPVRRTDFIEKAPFRVLFVLWSMASGCGVFPLSIECFSG